MLVDSGVFDLRNEGTEERYIEGEIDIGFDRLDMDSLAVMEICIALETVYRWPLNPERLKDFRTLNGLAAGIGEMAS